MFKCIRKGSYKSHKYVAILNFIRLYYETHTEIRKNKRKKYINIEGVEFCYKNKPVKKHGIGESIDYKYEPNSRINAYIMEDKITPEIKKIHCEQKGYQQLGYFPNLRTPRSLNEKIIWLALNYKNPNIAIAADKGKAKEWIAERIGSEYCIPTLGVYDDVNDIDFASLPFRFVAKLNDGWGGDKVMVVRNKSELDIDYTKAVLSSWLYPWNNYYYQNMCITDEKMEKPTIVIEEYLEQNKEGVLDDYKIYCCNGEPKFALIVNGRGTNRQTRSFVDMEWNVLPFSRRGKDVNHNVAKPACLDDMLQLCRKLSHDFPFVRIDFYEANGQIYVGEMTFTPGMFLRFSSKEWDFKLGEYLELPTIDP